MQLRFKQRMFSWFDSYDIYDEDGNTVYTVEGKLAWGHLLKIYDAEGTEVGKVEEEILAWLPKFELYKGKKHIGTLEKEVTLFKPRYTIDFNGWRINGDWTEWDYTIVDADGAEVATISKELFEWTDTYFINVEDAENALCALMVTLAIDAEKCSRK